MGRLGVSGEMSEKQTCQICKKKRSRIDHILGHSLQRNPSFPRRFISKALSFWADLESQVYICAAGSTPTANRTTCEDCPAVHYSESGVDECLPCNVPLALVDNSCALGQTMRITLLTVRKVFLQVDVFWSLATECLKHVCKSMYIVNH